jgi:hypothetical protein
MRDKDKLILGIGTIQVLPNEVVIYLLDTNYRPVSINRKFYETWLDANGRLYYLVSMRRQDYCRMEPSDYWAVKPNAEICKDLAEYIAHKGIKFRFRSIFHFLRAVAAYSPPDRERDPF